MNTKEGNLREKRGERLPLQVLIYCYTENKRNRQYLFLKRVKRLGEIWQGITGAPFAGENLIEAAKRELLEETGLAPISIEKVRFSYSFPIQEGWRKYYSSDVNEIKEFVFLAKIDKDAKISLSWEHDEYRWVNYKEGINLLYWPNNKKALEYCEKYLNGK